MTSNEPVKTKSLVRRTQLAFRKRWVQGCLLAMIWLFAILLTISFMAPKAPEKGKGNETSGYKFLHCDVCKMEMPYNPELDGKMCPKCRPPKTGFFFPTKESIKSGKGSLDPWNWVYVAIAIETLVVLAVSQQVLSTPIFDPKKAYYILPCPHCGQRLRYRGVSLGGLGSCSRCKRMIRFPEEEEAMLEEELLKLEAQVAQVMAEQAEAEAHTKAEMQAQAEYEAALRAEAEALAQAEAEALAQAEADAVAQAKADALVRAERKARKKAKRKKDNL